MQNTRALVSVQQIRQTALNISHIHCAPKKKNRQQKPAARKKIV